MNHFEIKCFLKTCYSGKQYQLSNFSQITSVESNILSLPYNIWGSSICKSFLKGSNLFCISESMNCRPNSVRSYISSIRQLWHCTDVRSRLQKNTHLKTFIGPVVFPDGVLNKEWNPSVCLHGLELCARLSWLQLILIFHDGTSMYSPARIRSTHLTSLGHHDPLVSGTLWGIPASCHVTLLPLESQWLPGPLSSGTQDPRTWPSPIPKGAISLVLYVTTIFQSNGIEFSEYGWYFLTCLALPCIPQLLRFPFHNPPSPYYKKITSFLNPTIPHLEAISPSSLYLIIVIIVYIYRDHAPGTVVNVLHSLSYSLQMTLWDKYYCNPAFQMKTLFPKGVTQLAHVRVDSRIDIQPLEPVVCMCQLIPARESPLPVSPSNSAFGEAILVA